jgi:hypothetical protein
VIRPFGTPIEVQNSGSPSGSKKVRAAHGFNLLTASGDFCSHWSAMQRSEPLHQHPGNLGGCS